MTHEWHDFPYAFGTPVTLALSRCWRPILLRGMISLIFGVFAFAWPGTLLTLLLFYGGYLLADGVLSMIATLSVGPVVGPWWLGGAGVASIAAGVFTVAWPGASSLALLYVMAIWAIVSGGLHVTGAIALWKEIEDEWLLAASGILSIFFGVLLGTHPGISALTLSWAIGCYPILYGLFLIGLSLRLRKYDQSHSDAIRDYEG